MKKLSKLLFTGLVIAVMSQLYLSFTVDEFRISTSVIMLPVLLVLFSKEMDSVSAGCVTGIIVFVLRTIISVFQGENLTDTFMSVYPATLFYVSYGMVFNFRVKNRFSIDYSRIFLTILLCDFISNMVEIAFRVNFNLGVNEPRFYFVLLAIAIIRTSLAYLILISIRQYKSLLKKEEHEKRYQNLITLVSDLKSEIYFMRKNIDNIENVMSSSYILYEELMDSNVDKELKRMSLMITNDIHEVKKDYIRVIDGIETSFLDKVDVENMSFSDIIYILKENTYRSFINLKKPIDLDFNYIDDFVTKDHFHLMSILTNLVNNAIDSIEDSKNERIIALSERKVNDNYEFVVKDTGTGIAKDNIEFIFNPGFSTKFDYETGDVYRGIGLTNVKSLVEEHFNGSIEVSSQEGKGTTFRICIPAEKLEVGYEVLHS